MKRFHFQWPWSVLLSLVMKIFRTCCFDKCLVNFIKFSRTFLTISIRGKLYFRIDCCSSQSTPTETHAKLTL